MSASEETRAKLQLWRQRNQPPAWWVWTGGWYESNGEGTYYVNWPLNPKSTVWDVGGYEGEWSRRIAKRYGCTIYTFEPSPRAYAVAVSNLKPFPQVVVCPFGLGASNRTVPLGDSNRDGASLVSSLPPIVQVPVADFVEVFRSFKVDTLDLMTVNIEGAEFELFPHILQSGLMSRIHRLMIQWHSIVPDYDHRQFSIQEQLACTHKMIWNLGAWEAWEQVAK